MILLDELRITMSDYRKDLKELYEVLGIEKAKKRFDELQQQMEDPNFYTDLENSQKVLQESKRLENKIGKYKKMEETLDDILTLIELTMEEGEEESNAELNAEADKFVEELESMKLASLLTGEYDASNAILTFHAGAGGTEAQDWTSMLLRMFSRFAEREGYEVEMLDYLPGDEAGVKSATLQINGHNAYGYLRSEKGVHRLVRISPFNSAGKRQTSFASCDVIPDIEDDIDIELNDDDLRIDTYRSSGAGGQHIPTGIIVQCQTQRSQIQNRERCLQLLRAKLYEYERAKQDALKSDIAGDYQDIEWGSQIRSYVFQPYKLVKDHRTNAETGNVQAVMDGGLEMFVEAYLRSQQKKL